MHKGLISAKEREMLEKFLSDQPTPKEFKVLKMLIKKYFPRIEKERDLLKKAYEKIHKDIN